MVIDYYELLKRLKVGAYENCVIVTFNADLVFFEQVVLPLLRSRGCRNNVVLMDSGQYVAALNTVGSQLQRLGKTYSLWPVAAARAFHPKIILQTNEKSARIIVGSGNLTVRGYSSNWEVFSEITFDRGSHSAPIFSAALELVNEATTGASQAVQRQLGRLKKTSGDVFKADQSDEFPRLLVASPTRPSLLDQVKSMIGRGKVKRVVVVSPFFDEKLQAIKEITSVFGVKKVVAIVQPNSVSFPGKSSKRLRDLAVHEFVPPRTDKTGYLHAKAIIIQTSSADFTIWGSSNCSMAALCGGGNYEAVLVSKFDSGEGVNLLGLGPSLKSENKFDPQTLEAIPSDGDSNSDLFVLKDVELDGHVIRAAHNPTKLVSGSEVARLLLETNGQRVAEIDMRRTGDNELEGTLESRFESSVVCRLVLQDGSHELVSTPAALHFLKELEEATPSRFQVKIQGMVDAIHNDTFEWANGLEQVCELVIRIGRDQSATRTQESTRRDVQKDESDDSQEEQPEGSYEDFVGEMSDRGDTAGKQGEYGHLEELVATLRSQILARVGSLNDDVDDSKDGWIYREEADRDSAEDGATIPQPELVDHEILEIAHGRVRRAYASLMRGLTKRLMWLSMQSDPVGLDEFWRLDAVNLLILNGCERVAEFSDLGPPLSANLVVEEFLPALTVFFGKSRSLSDEKGKARPLIDRAELADGNSDYGFAIRSSCLVMTGIVAHAQKLSQLDQKHEDMDSFRARLIELAVVRGFAAMLANDVTPDFEDISPLIERSSWLSSIGESEMSETFDSLMRLARSVARCEAQFETTRKGATHLACEEWVCSADVGVSQVIEVRESEAELAVFGDQSQTSRSVEVKDVIRTNIPIRVQNPPCEISEEFAHFLSYSDGDVEEWKSMIVADLQRGYLLSLSQVYHEAKSHILKELAAQVLDERGSTPI